MTDVQKAKANYTMRRELVGKTWECDVLTELAILDRALDRVLKIHEGFEEETALAYLFGYDALEELANSK